MNALARLSFTLVIALWGCLPHFLSQAQEATEPRSAADYDKEAAARINGFTLPEEITASLYADSSQVQNPGALCFDPFGNAFVAEVHRYKGGAGDIRQEHHLTLDDHNNVTTADRRDMYVRHQKTVPLSYYTEFADRVKRLRDLDGDGRADESVVWADGFDDMLDGPGIGLVSGYSDDLYYTNIPHLWYLQDTDGDGASDKRTSLQEGFGVRISYSGHDMHGLVWGPDGKLYWSIGDRGFHLVTKEGKEISGPLEGGVFRCNPDGSDLELYYRGLRNPQELAFDQYGNLFTCDNTGDMTDDGRLVYIIEGGNSGWTFGHQGIVNFKRRLNLITPSVTPGSKRPIPLNSWVSEGLCRTDHPVRPAFALPPIDIVSWGPCGLVYNYGATAVPERYDNHFWICNFGGAKADMEAFSVKEKGAGFALDHHEVYMQGVGNTDVEFGPDGRMYLLAFNNNGWSKQDIGNIYALEQKETPRRPLIEATRALLAQDLTSAETNALAEMLSHADMRVRLRAQFELARRSAAEVFAAALDPSNTQLARIHGIWGLGQLIRNDQAPTDPLIALLDDPDPEIRAQATKTLGETRSLVVGEALLPLLGDSSARVQAFAAIGAGKCKAQGAVPTLISLLEKNNNEDPFLRHACVEALTQLDAREHLIDKADHPSAAVRLGAVLALRRLESPEMQRFLDDPDWFIRFEAIRAINDLDLSAALPAVAALVDPILADAPDALLPRSVDDFLTQTRLINANFRVGQAENAARLIQYATKKHLDLVLREQALLALLDWKQPNPVDPTNGLYHPLDSESRGDITEAVKTHLPSLFEVAEGELVGLATQLALQYGAEATETLLLTTLNNTKIDRDSRIKALQGLIHQQSAQLSSQWNRLLKSDDARFKGAVVEALWSVDPARGLQAALDLANSSDIPERQRGYEILGRFDAPEATQLLKAKLTDRESENAAALYELLEGARNKAEQDPEIAQLLSDYESSLDPNDPLTKFRPALMGGDPERGADLFATHAVGSCSKCHIIDGEGGVAGPDLTEIGKSKSPEYLLEALVAPSAVVAPGYGMTLLTLKNGDTIAGALVKQTDESIILKIPDASDSTKQVEKTFTLEDVATLQPPTSAMPPMGLLMKMDEIRDLVAYLTTHQAKPRKPSKQKLPKNSH